MYSNSVDDPDIKECVDKLMTLNENTIKSFWNITPEEDELKLQRTREAESLARGRELGFSEGRELGIISVAKKLLRLNVAADDISKATGLSKEKIEKLKKE